VGAVIYSLTSSYGTSAHPGVTKGDQDGSLDSVEKAEGRSILSRPAVDVGDVIYGLTSSDCTSAHPGVTKGDQDGPLDSGAKVKVVKYIPNISKLLLAAGLKVSIEIGDYSYFFKSRTMIGLQTRILHHVMQSKSLKNY
jgi:hypothetical protein